MSVVGKVNRGVQKSTAYEVVGFEATNLPSRWMGRVNGAAPTVGTFAVGDWVLDASASAAVWVCIVAGSPGTWAKVGGGGAGLHVGPSAPTGSEVFWFDTDETCS